MKKNNFSTLNFTRKGGWVITT